MLRSFKSDVPMKELIIRERCDLVVPLGGAIDERSQHGMRPRRTRCPRGPGQISIRSIRTGQQSICQRERTRDQARRQHVEQRRRLCLYADRELWIASPAGSHNLARRPLHADGCERSRGAEREGQRLPLVLPLERSAQMRSHSHQARADGGHGNARLRKLGPKRIGQSDEREFAGAIRGEMRNRYLAAD